MEEGALRENDASNSGCDGGGRGKKPPVCLIVIGMAGSGKSTFVSRLAEFHELKSDSYVVNLDPACVDLPYNARIDIRDTIKYKDVMLKYKLGPNGAIVTTLNLFCSKFKDVIELLRNLDGDKNPYCVFDTPGQIEVYNWSASGVIITESLASAFPTVIVYVMDTPRSTNPMTFMSNMMYACSILYKYRLPLIVVMNKSDVVDHQFAIEWMADSDSFQLALDQMPNESYTPSLLRRMSLTLDKFYSTLNVCGVSAATGEGFDSFFALCEKSVADYWKFKETLAISERAERLAQAVQTCMPKSNTNDVCLRPTWLDSSDDEEGHERSKDDLEDEKFDPETNSKKNDNKVKSQTK